MSLRDTESGRRTNPREGAWRRPCSEFAETLPLLHDHELNVAQAADLEMHLAECISCQARAESYEQLSSVLKRWDAECNQAPVPQLRMQHAVLARVAEHGAHRRLADRTVRIVRVATAACMVLALGGAAIAGWVTARVDAPTSTTSAAHASDPVPWPAQVALDALPPTPRREALIDPANAHGLLASVSRWMDEPLPALPPAPQWAPLRGLTSASVARVARLSRLRDRVHSFSVRIDGPATVWLGVDGRGLHRIGVQALEHLRSSGALARWQQALHAANAQPTTTSAPAPSVSLSAERARDLLQAVPALRGDDAMDLLHGMGFTLRLPGLTLGGVPHHRLGGAGLRTHQGGATWIDALDPMQAQAEGKLRLSETLQFERVVAFVSKTDRPIFIPDGQLLVRGAKDRVVAQATWLPASDVEVRYVIPCRVVQNGVRREDPQPPILSDWIAGPTVRSLLRREVTDVELLGAIGAQLRLVSRSDFEGAFGTWSLADLAGAVKFAGPDSTSVSVRRLAARMSKRIRAGFIDQGIQGFVAHSSAAHGSVAQRGPATQGTRPGHDTRMFGVEITRLRGEAGSALLNRLYWSYALESIVVSVGARTAAFEPAPAQRATYATLRSDVEGLEERKTSVLGHRVRTLRRTVTPDGNHARRVVHVEAFDVDGTPALVSLTAEPALPRH